MDINEIARLAGVSRATVSRYLNDGYVSEEKRRLIRRVIQETGYVPSRLAQQLRTGKTGLVGIIIPKIYSQSVSRMVAGITDGFKDTEYHMLLSNTNNDPDEEVRCLRVLSERPRVDGVILIATVITNAHLEALRSLSAPVVVLGQHVDGFSCVYHNDYRATFDVARVALRTAQHPAYIGVRDDDVAAGTRRQQGFMDACRAAGIDPSPVPQLTGDFSMESGYLCCEQIMDEAPETDTIICATDNMAFGALACLREYGHDAPDEVQVTGIGDWELSRILTPSLTTVHLFYKTSGIEAAKLLLQAMESGDNIPRQLRMGYEVYVRNSTRPFAQRA